MGNGKVITMQDWMNEWLTTFIQPNRAAKTYSCYKAVINILGRECPQLSKITPHEMDTIQAQKILNGLEFKFAKSTLNSMRVVFHESMQRACEIHALHALPLGRLMVPKQAAVKQVRAMTRAEQAAVEEAAETELLGYLAIFFLRTGLRAAELCNLRWDDYNATNQTIRILKSKTKAGIRFVPLCTEAQQIICAQHKCCNDNAIFHSSTGNPVTEEVLQKLSWRLRRVTGVEFLTTHVYRHTFATRALEDGMNVKALSKILGHTDVAFTMQRYCSPDVNFLREQMDLIDQVRKNRNN